MARKSKAFSKQFWHRSLSRREALGLIGKTSAVALLASACGVESPPKPLDDPKRPNIIYLHTHDSGDFAMLRMRYKAVEEFAESYPDLPYPENLFGFGCEGVTFEKAFSAAPTCSPSRAALLTGMTPGCNGMWGLAHLGYELNDYGQSLIPFLNRAGYVTALVGVQHIAAGKPQDCAERIGYQKLLPSKGRKAADVAAAAVNFLKNAPEKPFFLDIGFAETHLLPDGESRFGYDAGDPNYAYLPLSLEDKLETRRDMADLRVALGQLDTAIGRVLKALDTAGLRHNTLVIITTDHGIPLPGMKGNHTDRGLEVMLMIRGPEGLIADGKRGQIIPSLVSQIDIFPTICEILELPPPPWLQGTSLVPLLRGPNVEINEAIYAEHEAHAVKEPQASVRTKRHKYIRRLDGSSDVRLKNIDDTYTKELWLREGWPTSPGFSEQLYDLTVDPDERTNLIDSPNHADVLAKLRGLMVARMEQYDNPLLRRYNVTAGPPVKIKPQGLLEPTRTSNESYEIGVLYTGG